MDSGIHMQLARTNLQDARDAETARAARAARAHCGSALRRGSRRRGNARAPHPHSMVRSPRQPVWAADVSARARPATTRVASGDEPGTRSGLRG